MGGGPSIEGVIGFASVGFGLGPEEEFDLFDLRRLTLDPVAFSVNEPATVGDGTGGTTKVWAAADLLPAPATASLLSFPLMVDLGASSAKGGGNFHAVPNLLQRYSMIVSASPRSITCEVIVPPTEKRENVVSV